MTLWMREKSWISGCASDIIYYVAQYCHQEKEAGGVISEPCSSEMILFPIISTVVTMVIQSIFSKKDDGYACVGDKLLQMAWIVGIFRWFWISNGGGASDSGLVRSSMGEVCQSNAIRSRQFTPSVASTILPLLGYLNLEEREIFDVLKCWAWINDFNSVIFMLWRWFIVVVCNCIFSYGLEFGDFFDKSETETWIFGIFRRWKCGRPWCVHSWHLQQYPLTIENHQINNL